MSDGWIESELSEALYQAYADGRREGFAIRLRNAHGVEYQVTGLVAHDEAGTIELTVEAVPHGERLIPRPSNEPGGSDAIAEP